MPPTATSLQRVIGFRSAIGLVVGTIIGTGMFTGTGFQAADLGHPGYIFLLWIVGGILSLCGALCYCEPGAALPRSGGEYAYVAGEIKDPQRQLPRALLIGTLLVTLVILVALLSAASSLILAGSRVYYAMGQDSPAFRWLAGTRRLTGAPHRALFLQGII